MDWQSSCICMRIRKNFMPNRWKFLLQGGKKSGRKFFIFVYWNLIRRMHILVLNSSLYVHNLFPLVSSNRIIPKYPQWECFPMNLLPLSWTSIIFIHLSYETKTSSVSTIFVVLFFKINTKVRARRHTRKIPSLKLVCLLRWSYSEFVYRKYQQNTQTMHFPITRLLFYVFLAHFCYRSHVQRTGARRENASLAQSPSSLSENSETRGVKNTCEAMRCAFIFVCFMIRYAVFTFW